MSEMLKTLEGCCCSIKNEEGEYLTGSADIACDVLTVDDEFMKLAFVDRHGRRLIRLVRVETVESVDIFHT